MWWSAKKHRSGRVGVVGMIILIDIGGTAVTSAIPGCFRWCRKPSVALESLGGGKRRTKVGTWVMVFCTIFNMYMMSTNIHKETKKNKKKLTFPVLETLSPANAALEETENVQTGQQIGHPLHGHTDDGEQVVSGSDDETVRIWNVQTGQQIGDPLCGHTNWVSSVTFSPDGQQVVTGSYDRTVRIWNAQTGQQNPLHGSSTLGPSTAFSSNSPKLVAPLMSKDIIKSLHPLHSMLDKSLQLPPNIYHGSINQQGRLCSHDTQLLLWLPPWMIPGFRDKRQVLTIPSDAPNCAISVNLDNFVYDCSWTKCWDSSHLYAVIFGLRPKPRSLCRPAQARPRRWVLGLGP
ncbi:hypothetical protein D9757_012118 [Collybiopsis confluens]|uniref:WD40 repeat-like protein n=1 Tax=Collybiopsis confluens TaxID=2823264 RepID=A0A8H5LQ57_9AGAR|nr:hypothetical protein D9757_012118 [Collybiopsis confluens]